MLPEEPIRKSRRLQGEAPEIIVDEFYMRESKPYVPSKSEKELLAEREGDIVCCFAIASIVVVWWWLWCFWAINTGQSRRSVRHSEKRRCLKFEGWWCCESGFILSCRCRKMDFPYLSQWSKQGGSRANLQYGAPSEVWKNSGISLFVH